MTIMSFAFMAVVVISLWAGFRYSDRFIRTLSRQTVKMINWAGFTIAVLGGILWYGFKLPSFMLVTLLGIIVYFMFYGYDRDIQEDPDKKPWE
ncbi:MAG: hypothetical protein HY880_04055 [Deltaproteobacteria bacterium]|nr:hypothetical protein [Deltaproteobacteria bacterium]